MDRYENYISDQFPGRNAFRKLYTSFCRIGGSTLENDVYYGKNGQLLKAIAPPDEVLMEKNRCAIETLTKKYMDTSIYCLLVPDAVSILADSLPAAAPDSNQLEIFQMFQTQLPDTVKWIDGVSVFQQHAKEPIYYKTDHHWTTYGAYTMFMETASELGIKKPDKLKYAIYPVTESFNGALAGLSGFETDAKETIEVYLPEKEIPYVVHYIEEVQKMATLYDAEALTTKDKYGVFLGGNHSLIEITSACDSEKVLLIAKDSFANSFIPFLVPYYRKIIIADPRYYDGTASELIENYSVTDVLLLYSGSTFFTDSNVAGFIGD